MMMMMMMMMIIIIITITIITTTRSTQRAQTSLAEADHYSHIAHCKNIEPWWWKTTPPPPLPPFRKKKVLDHYLHSDLGMPLLWCLFAHLLILEYPEYHQNVISSSLYYPGLLHKILSQSVHNFLSNVVHRQTDRQTNATKNITSFAKEVIIVVAVVIVVVVVNVNVNVEVYSLKSPWVQQTLQFTPLVLELSLIRSHLLWGEFSAFSAADAIHNFSNFRSTRYPSLLGGQTQHGMRGFAQHL